MKPKKNGIQEILESGQFPGLNTSACKDHDFIPHDRRVVDLTDRRPEKVKERAFEAHIQETRKNIYEHASNKAGFRQTHAVPADLYHGKIRETGDKNYWDDPTNVARHKSCKVD